MTVLAVVVMSVLMIGMSSYADSNHAGAFLRMGTGARALGMGGAFTGLANDATAGYWNPAGLTQIKRIEIFGMYSTGMTADMGYNYLAYGQTFPFGSIGISWINSGMSDIGLYNGAGEPTGTDNYSSNAFTFSYAKGFQKFSFGLNVKMLLQSIPGGDDESGFGLDFGFMYRPTPLLSFGVMAQDLASKLGDETIPANFRLGLAVHPIDGLNLAADVEKMHNEDGATIHFGAEYWMTPMENTKLGARAGMNGDAFAAGLSFVFSIVEFDYGYVSSTEEALNDNHRISLGVKF